MKILLTGATGFIGSHLIGPISQNHEVIALVRQPPKVAPGVEADFVQGNLSDPGIVAGLPSKIDVVIHLAQAENDFPENSNEMFQVNLASTQVLADYARRAQARQFVYASTGNVYKRSASAYTELSPVEAESFYEVTKLSSENLLKLYSSWFNVSILRLFTPYGPGQQQRMLTKIADLVRSKQPVVLHNGGQPFVSPVYIDDLISILLQAVGKEISTVINISGDEAVSVKAIAEQAAEFFGWPPIFEEQKNDLSWNLICDNGLMKVEFNVGALVSFPQGYNAYLSSRKVG